MCGRRPFSGGKHVMWVSDAFPKHRAFPIPRHGGNPVASYTVRNSVLDWLEADAAAWEEALEDSGSVNGVAMEAAEVLTKPYVRQVVPQPDGLFKAEILEFPGCFAIGDTATEALSNLEEVVVDWVAASIAQHQDIPEPTESTGYSGKTVLRMSKTLHKKAAQFARRDGVSLNQFIVNCLAEHVGMLARPSLQVLQPANLHANLTLQVGWPLMAPITSGALLVTPRNGTVRVPLQTTQEETYA